MFEFNPISLNLLVSLGFLALIIFTAQRIINVLIKRWLKKETQESLLSVYVPITVNFIWIFFFLFAVYKVALTNPIMSIFISALILISTWSFVKDFVQGTLFKFQKGNLVGQLLKTDSISGKVVKMKDTRIHIQLESGDIVEYPYSKLTKAITIMSSNEEDFKNSTLNLTVSNQLKKEEVKTQLRLLLYNTPWVASNRSIKIDVADHDAERISFKINVYTIDENFIPKIQQVLDSAKFN